MQGHYIEKIHKQEVKQKSEEKNAIPIRKRKSLDDVKYKLKNLYIFYNLFKISNLYVYY